MLELQNCLQLEGPPSKPKYVSMTDSEQVPWGKGEKNPKKGSEIDPEIRSKQSVEGIQKKQFAMLRIAKMLRSSASRNTNGVPFV